jgi:N-acetylglutamate synthase-like GNAT family acetyltransferase
VTAPLLTYRAGQAGDIPRLEELLRAAHLPANRVLEYIEAFVIAEQDGAVVGGGGVEVYGDTALLRSVVIDETLRGQGVGRSIAERLIANAVSAGARDLYLYTYDSRPFWLRLGFEDLTDAQWREPVRQSWQWQYVTSHAEEFAKMGLVSMWRRIEGET